MVRIPCPEGGPFAQAGTMPVLQEACDQLIGAGRWWRRAGMGGSIPVRFPGEADPGDAGWHIEASYEEAGSSGSTPAPGPAGCSRSTCSPTWTRRARRPGCARARTGMSRRSWPRRGMRGWSGCLRRSRPRGPARTARPALATGRAGDVFLCHPFLVHAASWPHRGHRPRMIAQPGVALHGQYALRAAPGETPPPVQQVILDSLAAAAR